MTKLEKIEEAVSALSKEELAAFRKWFAEYAGDEWDRQIEADIRAGRLDDLAAEAIADHRAGRTEPV
ncbi:MAG: hypothetical protein JNM20_16645 [Rhizobiales bacterium]|nr:hypothetical protein [Hyphomicrobiales bacterium]